MSAALCNHLVVCLNVCFHGLCSQRPGSFHSGLVWKIMLLVWRMCHISCSAHQKFPQHLFFRTDIPFQPECRRDFGQQRLPRSLVNDDRHYLKKHFKTYQKVCLKSSSWGKRRWRKKSLCHKEMEEMAQVHHALCSFCFLKSHGGENTMQATKRTEKSIQEK